MMTEENTVRIILIVAMRLFLCKKSEVQEKAKTSQTFHKYKT
ncbi:MAG: hypothetical protein Q4D07_09975 [Selenomonadaceae bacterium]|nr:hypothetical protein [Selenomonadaceae bacterium]